MLAWSCHFFNDLFCRFYQIIGSGVLQRLQWEWDNSPPKCEQEPEKAIALGQTFSALAMLFAAWLAALLILGLEIIINVRTF